MNALSGCRTDFPIFRNHPHTYLDNAATTHKPKQVIEAIADFYAKGYGTVHRGIYRLSVEATDRYEQARTTVQQFIGAQKTSEIIFTRGTTEGINLVASSYLRPRLSPGDNVVCTVAEHHANFIPWQQAAMHAHSEFRCIALNSNQTIHTDLILQQIDQQTKLVAIHQLSNVLGHLIDLHPIIVKAHAVGAKVLVDAAQSVAHASIRAAPLCHRARQCRLAHRVCDRRRLENRHRVSVR